MDSTPTPFTADVLFVLRSGPGGTRPSEAALQAWANRAPDRRFVALAGALPGWILGMGLKNVAGKPLWEQLRQDLAVEGALFPAQPNWFPTGELTVRREAGWTPPQLRTLTGRHEVSLVRRAAFISREALFKPLQPPSTYLPEALEKLKRDPLVDEAWMDAQVAFKRGR